MNDCSGKGTCYDGSCLCDKGYRGADCSERYVVHGKILSDGNVICDEGWTGAACDEKPCLLECSNHGKCFDGYCVCEPGFTGKVCNLKSCKDDLP